MVASIHSLVLLATLLYSCSVHALQYNGTSDSWARYSKWNVCPHRDAVLYLRIEALKGDGLIAYMEAGNTDYMLLKITDQKISLEYKFGFSSEPAMYERGDKEIELGKSHFLTIRRYRMWLKLELEDATGAYRAQIPNYGGDLCFGECQDGLDYTPSSDISDLYIGGLPPNIRDRAAGKGIDMPPQFDGEIYDVEYKNCDCRRSNPYVLEVGEQLKSVTGDDPCFNQTSSRCPCRLYNEQTCQCNSDCVPENYQCPTERLIRYNLGFDHQAGDMIVNDVGLDAKIFGTPRLKSVGQDQMKYLYMDGDTHAQMAGESQRDECLGNLDLCNDGYTLSFWMMIDNSDLMVNDGTLIDNGGYNSHGVAVYWQNGKLITKFVRPNGFTWINEATDFFPAKIYNEGSGQFVDYWYHYAASWSRTEGLHVYLNGQSVGTTRNPSSQRVPDQTREPFILGSTNNANKMGIANIQFLSSYQEDYEIFNTTGPRHYYFSMNRLDGRLVPTWPLTINARTEGDAQAQLVKGRADMALMLGRSDAGMSYIDAGDVSNTCFGNVRDCDMYTSFWVKFDQLRNGMTILDTGNEGITFQYQDQKLMALIYESSDEPIILEFPFPQTDQWYFVELDRNAGNAAERLYVNGQLVDEELFGDFFTQPAYAEHNGVDKKLLIGKKNADVRNSYPITGQFTIDQLEMLQGNREFLRNIGHIQRGIPPHALYSLDGFVDGSGGYLSYIMRNIKRDPKAEINEQGRGYQFVPGKDMNGLSLTGSTFEITQSRRNQECYNNIEKCHHGILVRGWFNMENLQNNAGLMSTGMNGIDMSYQNNRLVVTADSADKRWQVEMGDVSERKWQFLEISYHPKYGLTLYKDQQKIDESISPSNNLVQTGSNKFIVGGTNDQGQRRIPMIIDDLEIWYGDRDYVNSVLPDCTSRGSNSRWVIDFDGVDPYVSGRLNHQQLVIEASGAIDQGLYENALTMSGGAGQYAEVTEIKQNQDITKLCFGNLTMCSRGYTVQFYVKPEAGSLRDNGRPTYFLSTGTNGIDVFYKDGRLHALARSGDILWNVSSPMNYLTEDHWNTIIVAWSPIKGLVLAKDESMYRVAQDSYGTALTPAVANNLNSRFLIGRENSGVGANNFARGLRAAFDDMLIDECFIPPRLGPTEHESVSFERNHLDRNKVEHPRFNIRLMDGASIIEGQIGNSTLLNGLGQYVDLGTHTDTCIDNLEKCDSGLTMSFSVNPKGGSYQPNQVILSGASYDISLVEDAKLQVRLMTSNKEWEVKSYRIQFDTWTQVDVSWTEEDGLKLYVDGSLSSDDMKGSSRVNRVSSDSSLLVGKANNHANRRYFNGMIDEITFYQTTRRELVKKEIITPNRCDIRGLFFNMTTLTDGGIITHNNPRVVEGLLGNGIELEAYKHIDVGDRLTCQSRPSACANGFTMRFSMKPSRLNRNSYLISSNPAEVVFGNDDNLHVRYRSVSGIWEGVLSGLEYDVWYTIDLSWDNENGMTVYVNNEQRSWSQLTSSAISNYDQSNPFFINKPNSDLITAYEQSAFVIDNLQLWDAKLEKLKSCGLLPPAIKAEKHHAIYPPGGDGYVRIFYLPTEFDVSGYHDEQMTIKFETGRRDGLLWYNQDGDIRSYIYLKAGDLWFATKNGDRPTVEKKITNNQNLADSKDHTLYISSRNGNSLVFNVDGSPVNRFDSNHRIRFIKEDFNVGGHKSVTDVTGGRVTGSFIGTIKDVIVNSTGFDKPFDIFAEMWKDEFPKYVRAHCNMVFEPEIDFICDVGDAAVTFMENNTYINLDKWDNVGKKPSLEVRFTTVEPRGLLLFAGSKDDDYFALEMFDNKLYMVTDVGNGMVRRQVSVGDAADNIPHSAKFVFNSDEGKINVYFDRQRRSDLDVILPSRNRLTLFSDSVYLGGVPDYNQLPWHIWSEAGFMGCVDYLQINTISSELRKLRDLQRSPNIVNGCQAFTDYCAYSPCRNGAPCYNRKDSYYCDCTGLDYANIGQDVCATLTLIAVTNGTEYKDINLGRNIKTHVNDISTKFKTLADRGTMWMTNSPTNSDYIKVFFEEGELKVAVSGDGLEEETTIPGVYNDFEWHTLNVRRRADKMHVWVDDNQHVPIDLRGEDFYIYMDTIRLGADIPNPGEPPYFLGQQRTWKYPPIITGYPFEPPTPFLPELYPITILTPVAHIRVPNEPDEMKLDFKVILMIKTQQKDSLFMYQPGNLNSQYLAALLNNGQLDVRFNFGGIDERITVPRSYLSDDRWHMIEISREDQNTMSVTVDQGTPQPKRLSSDRGSVGQFDHSDVMYIGGIPSGIRIAEGLRSSFPDGITGYRGCLATLVKARHLINMGDVRFQDSQVRNSGSVVTGCQPQPVCVESQCLNGCRCSASGAFCDNSMIPFIGPYCSQPEVGYKFYVDKEPGSVTYSYVPSISNTEDIISFGFITCKKSGTLAKITGRDENELIKIYLQDGRIVADTKLSRSSSGSLMTTGDYSDSKMYIVQYSRNGRDASLRIVDPATGRQLAMHEQIISGSDNMLDGITTVEVGSASNQASGQYDTPFDGVVIGFKHGASNIFQYAKNSARGATVKLPGTSRVTSEPTAAFTCTTEEGVCGPDRPTCKNYGVCMNNQCNCTLTAWAGPTCELEPEGHYYGWYNFKPGVVIHEYPQAVSTFADYLAIGLMTYEPNGTIFRVENVDGTQYYDLRLVNGHAQLEYRLADNQPQILREERITLNSRDSDYHVIRMNRTGDMITFYVDDLQINRTDASIANIPFRGQKYLMSGGITTNRNNLQIADDWNGILAGLRYNNEYIYHRSFVNDDTITKVGDVDIAGHPFKLKFEPPPTCQVCHNGGLKLEDGTCDCLYTGYSAPCCEKRDGLWGFHMKKDGSDTVVVYKNESMVTDQDHRMSVSFRTANGWPDGEIIRVLSKDGSQYMLVELVNDRVRVRYNFCGEERIETFQTVDNIRQQTDHIVNMYRNGKQGYIELDNIKRGFTNFPECDFNPSYVYTGGSWDGTHVTSGHYGIIWGAVYNGHNIVDITRGTDAKGKGVTVHTSGGDSWDIVPYPWPALCDKGETKSECTALTVAPPPPGGAGSIIKIGHNVGVVPKPAAVVAVGGAGVSVYAIIGAVMGGLLFSSAIAFAAAGMKPGFLAVSKGLVGGGGGKGAYVPVADGKSGAFPVSNGGNYGMGVGMDGYGGGVGGSSQAGSRLSQYEESMTQESRFDGTDGGMGAGMNGGMNGGAVMNGGGGGSGGYNAYNQSSSWYQRNETMQNEAMGYGGGGSTMGGYGRGAGGYAGSVAGGSVSGSVYGFGTVTNPDQAFITLSEDIAVDNVVLTADGRYVVTGSNLGPPQVWNTNNGEMVTTMRGDFMGSTGLHLAANEQYLIGETMAEQAAVDMNDVQTGNHIPIRRVAVWDFNTGNPLPVAVDQLCTASCVSKDGYKVVMAMTDKFGGGTTVKVLDLLSNKVLHEITYPDTIGVADSASCVFISPDDRFVAVGFTNSFDNNANFIVFDLFNKAGVIDSPIVALNADPHCTVILNHDEALTGTRNGELVIWSMKTGKAQRQLTSGDATMLGHGGMPAAHDREVKEVALSEDGKYLASASVDRTVKAWNMDSESLMHTLHGHNDEVWTVDIASDNSIIVSGSQDGTIKLWRLRNGNQITSFNATMDIFHARFSKDKKTVVALGDKYGARKLIMLQIVSQKKWRMRST